MERAPGVQECLTQDGPAGFGEENTGGSFAPPRAFDRLECSGSRM